MKNELTPEQVNSYQENGFLVIEDFLSADELAFWRIALDEALANRNGDKLPGRKDILDQNDPEDKTYYNNVFDQMINIWQYNEKMREIRLDERRDKMASI